MFKEGGSTMKQFKAFNVMVIGLLLLTGALLAQQTTARIVGTVQLEDGSLLPGVLVEASSPSLVGNSSSRTDENGAFRLTGLAPGIYRVTFSLEGFQPLVRENIPLQVEQTVTLRIAMTIGPLNEALTITGQIPLIDVKSTAKGMTVNRGMFQSLPKGRNFDGLVAIVPGIVNENFLGGISIDGSSGGENIFYVDGQNTNSVFGGRGAQQVAFDFVDEVQVKASGYQAEFGGSLGGVINVVTRSGGNEFHGDIVAYFSGSALSGTERDSVQLDPFSSQPVLQQFNYAIDRDQALKESRLEGGFGLGGYIIRDKLWFYANAMPVFRRTAVPAVFLIATDPAHAASDINNGIFNRYDYSQSNDDYNFQLKLSSQLAGNLRLAVSWVNNTNSWKDGLPDRNGSSSDSIPWTALGYTKPNYSVSGNIDYSLGNNFMASARAGYFYLGTRNNLDPAYANTSKNPLYMFMGSNAGTAGILPENVRGSGWQNLPKQAMTYPHEIDEEDNFSTGVDLNYFLNLAGEHAWKVGVAYTRAAVKKNMLYNGPQVRLSWTSTRGSVEVRGGPNSRDSAEFGKQYGMYGSPVSDRLALYLQDSWTIANRFTLNAGLRLESENVPSFNDDPAWAEYIGRDILKFSLLDKVSPRVGFIYDVKGDSSLKAFGSYGIYNDVMELDLALGLFGGIRWINEFYFLSAAHVNEWMNIGKLLPDGSRDYSMLTFRYALDYNAQSWGLVDPNLKPMTQSEVTLGLEKKIADNLSLSVRGTWRSLIRTIDDVGVEIPNDQDGGFEVVYYIANPGFGWASPISMGGRFSDDFWPTPKAQRDYKALNITLEKRMSNNWLGGVNLTISRLYGNYSGIVSADEVNNMGTGYGRSGGNVTSYFDLWWMPYTQDGKQTQNNGLLPTDRPIVLKAYGSYAFPFGLTVGGVANFMSGTPRSTEWSVDVTGGYYPLGRNDLGRTPNLWFLNLYAEYNLKLGRNALQFSINVDNVTNNDTGTWYWTRINVTTPYIFWDDFTDDSIKTITEGYDFRAWEGTYPQTVGTWLRDPRFNKALQFQPPIAVRLGVKFVF
jgi:hypothetical protein